MIPKLQFISQDNAVFSHSSQVRRACEEGVTWVQMRMKSASDEQLIAEGKKIRAITADFDATFIVNDRPDIAELVNADGVHLGVDDMPVSDARKIIGNKIIGGTANTFKDVLMHHKSEVDYIGLGPFQHTKTKRKLSPLLGQTGYRNILKEMEECGLKLPLVAIGGIMPKDFTELFTTGIDGVAMSGAILKAMSQPGEVAAMIELINQITSLEKNE